MKNLKKNYKFCSVATHVIVFLTIFGIFGTIKVSFLTSVFSNCPFLTSGTDTENQTQWVKFEVVFERNSIFGPAKTGKILVKITICQQMTILRKIIRF
jgi:hypothetical protein